MKGIQKLLSLKVFQQPSTSENPLADDPRYEMIRSLGRGSFGSSLPAGFRFFDITCI